MSPTIRTAVFPVAGRGTRFLPATKASPKEMLPVVDKPLIQYAVEEALAAGATRLAFVTGSSKRSIEDHFDTDHELEAELERKGNKKLLAAVRDIVPASATCLYIRQPAALGLGHAVLCARAVVGDEPFYVHLADDLIDADVPCLAQMQEVYAATEASVVAVQRVPREHSDRYGIVETDPISKRRAAIRGIVEKPTPAEAPSNLAVVGRYLLTPAIFDLLAETGRGAGGEIQLTDAIGALLASEKVFAYEFQGTRYDCGTKLGYLKATVEYGLRHEELGGRFEKYLLELVERLTGGRHTLGPD